MGSSANLPEAVAWLRLEAGTASTAHIIEYSMKGPLYAASAVLERKGDQLEAKAKASFAMKHWESRSSVEGSGRNETFEFGVYREHSPKENEVKAGTELTRLLRVCQPPAPILAAPQLLFAFAETVNAKVDLYGAFFVAGGRLLSLRLHRTAPEVFAGQVLAAGQDVSAEAWMGASWSDAKVFELHWDSATHAAKELRFRMPPVGMLKAKLTRNEASAGQA